MASREYAIAKPVARPVELEWFTRLEDVERFRDPWLELASSIADRTVFVDPDYLIAWYRYYGLTRGSPLLGLAWSHGRLVGVAPFLVWDGSLGRIPVRRIDFVGDEADAGEFVIRDDMPELEEMFLGSLAETTKFDVLSLCGLLPGSEKLEIVRGAAAKLGYQVERFDYRYARADVAAGFDAYARVKGSNFRRRVRVQAGRVAAAGPWEVSVLSGERDSARIEQFIQRMVALLEEGWKLRPEGRLPEMHRGFYSEVVRRFGARGMVDLAILSIGGRDAAFMLALLERGIYYDVTIDYDSHFAKCSPGSHLRHEVLRRLGESEIHTVYSHGDYKYKRRWATEFAPQTRLFLFSSSPRAAVCRIARFKLPQVWELIRRNGRGKRSSSE